MKTIPVEACQFRVNVEVKDNGPDTTTAPVKMLARSGDAVDHWYWGKLIHDLAGMKLAKPRVVIDYNHNPNEVIGYLNHFETESGDLLASGAVTPFAEHDRASEVVFKARAGVPYEASINFAGDGVVIQHIDEQEIAEVNGREFAGPGVIIREWPLRGVAITPYGCDAATETELSANSKTIQVEEMEPMTTPKTQLAVDNNVEAEDKLKSGESTAVDAPAGAPSADQDVAHRALAQSDGARFLDAFGARGGVWYAEGVSFEDATAKHAQELSERIAALEADNKQLRESAASSGEQSLSAGAEGNSIVTDEAVRKLTRTGMSTGAAKLALAIEARM